MKQAVAYFFLSLLLGTAAFSAQQHVPAFPQTGATRLQDGKLLTVWDVQRHKGQPSGFERHELDEVAVTLAEGAVKVQRPDGTWSIEQRRFGSVRYLSKGIVQSEEGLSDPTSRAIVFQLKSTEPVRWPATPGVPGQFPRVGTVKLFETDRVVVWDQTWRPGERITRHLHYAQTAAVFLEGGRLRTIDDGRPPNPPFVRKPGEVLYADAPTPLALPHEEEYVDGAPRAIWLEFK